MGQSWNFTIKVGQFISGDEIIFLNCLTFYTFVFEIFWKEMWLTVLSKSNAQKCELHLAH